MPGLIELGKRTVADGHTKSGDWARKMRDHLGESWNTFKSKFVEAWKLVKDTISNERGNIKLDQKQKSYSIDRNEVSQFIDNAVNDKKTNNMLDLRPVFEEEAAQIKLKTGLDVKGYTHTLNAFDIRHILNKHGIGNEKQRNQIPLTEQDLNFIPDILNTPENIEKGSTSQQGKPTIRYMKSDENGRYFVVEIIREKDQTLSVKTMWKKSIAKNYVSETTDPHHTSTSVFTLTPDGDMASSKESTEFQSRGLQLPPEETTIHDSINNMI